MNPRGPSNRASAEKGRSAQSERMRSLTMYRLLEV
jgi:hypothetical protein